MNKRVWLVILCIVTVGITVTWGTSHFISSRTGSQSGSYALETAVLTKKQEAEAIPAPAAAAPAPVTVAPAPVTAAPAPAAGTYVYEAARSGDAGEAEPPMAELAEENMAEEEAENEEAAGQDTAGPALQGAVKSPLETAALQEKNSKLAGVQVYSLEELRERLDIASAQFAQNSETLDSNLTSHYAAAEYEKTVWDGERALIYRNIRNRMSETEAEKLKAEEIAWLKERDLIASRTYLQNGKQPEQSAEYVRDIAEKTRLHCYELLERYGEILDREPPE